MAAGLFRRGTLMIIVPVALFALTGFETAPIERHSALRSADATQQSQRLLTAMLDQETGARGYFDAQREVFLQPWFTGTREFAGAVSAIRRFAAGDPDLQREL